MFDNKQVDNMNKDKTSTSARSELQKVKKHSI